MIKTISFVVVALGIAVSASAQVKRQAAVGVSAIAPRVETAAPATTVHVAFALIVPAGKKFFLRPVVTLAEVNPTPEGKKNFLSVSGIGLVGFRVNPAFSVLGGWGVTINLPAGQPATKLPTVAFSTATKINGHFGVFTPVTVTSKGVGIATQLGVTW